MAKLYVKTPNGIQREVDLDSILNNNSNLDATKLTGLVPAECCGDNLSIIIKVYEQEANPNSDPTPDPEQDPDS